MCDLFCGEGSGEEAEMSPPKDSLLGLLCVAIPGEPLVVLVSVLRVRHDDAFPHFPRVTEFYFGWPS